MTKCDKGGRGVEPKSDVTQPNIFYFKFRFAFAAEDVAVSVKDIALVLSNIFWSQ